MSGASFALVGVGPAGRAVTQELIRAGGRLVAACDPNRVGEELTGHRVTQALPPVLDVDLLLLAVPDDAYAKVAAALAPGIRMKMVLQLSASAPLSNLQTLASRGAALGLLHPAQSLVDGAASTPILNWTYCGDRAWSTWVRDLLPEGAQLLELNSEDQVPYHVACTMLANTLPALWSLASACWPGDEEDLARIAPQLLRTSLENLLNQGPREGLSGPVRRGDRGTVARHLNWLEQHCPEVLPAYLALSERLVQLCGEPQREKAGSSLNSWLAQNR